MGSARLLAFSSTGEVQLAYAVDLGQLVEAQVDSV